LKLIAAQYSPTADPGGKEVTLTPTAAPSRKPTAKPSVLMVSDGAGNAMTAGNGTTTAKPTPSPVLVQYVFVREPTAAPTSAAGRGRAWPLAVALGMAVVCWVFE